MTHKPVNEDDAAPTAARTPVQRKRHGQHQKGAGFHPFPCGRAWFTTNETVDALSGLDGN